MRQALTEAQEFRRPAKDAQVHPAQTKTAHARVHKAPLEPGNGKGRLS